MRTQRHNRSGFTLIEILIVVVILGILAAIVIPQFTDASQEAGESSTKSQLQTVRSQIELYRVKNGGVPPAALDDLVTDGYIQQDPTASIQALGYDWNYDNSTGALDMSDCPATDTTDECLTW